MDHNLLGKRIREERVRRHLTQEKLAEEVQLSTAYIGQIERNERSLTLENLVAIANCLNVTVEYFLSAPPTPTQKTNLKIWNTLTKNRSSEEKLLVFNVIKTFLSSYDYVK